MIRKQKSRTAISNSHMPKSDLLVLNEGLWMYEEKEVTLKAASMRDKDAECANIQHRSSSSM